MKRFVLFCILVARGLGADANLEPAGWPLAAHFPNLPTVKQSPPSKDARFIGRAVAAKDGASYGQQRTVLNRTALPPDVHAVYQSVKAFMLQGRPAKLIEEEKITVCGAPALRYLIEYNDGARRVEFREVMLLIDGQVETYQFMHDYSPSGKNLFEGKEFFASAAKQSETARP